MPIKYVGIPDYCHGRRLFEILCNLKNFGVGRIVVRSALERYPEPSYYKIVKVEPMMESELRKGTVWADEVFRGRKREGVEILSVCKDDFRLLHKDEEEAYINRPYTPMKLSKLPMTAPFPPLLRYMIVQSMKRNGVPVEKEPELKMVYNTTPYNYSVIDEGLNMVYQPKHASPHLYVDLPEQEQAKQQKN